MKMKRDNKKEKIKIEKKERKSLEDKFEYEFECEVIEFINNQFQDFYKNWICIWIFKIYYLLEITKNY